MKTIQKKIVIAFCEGEAEINLFSFLKLQYSNKKIGFITMDLGGFSDFKIFKRKYDKKIKEQNLKPKKDYAKVQFLFVIDNDLEDSEKIKIFLEERKHYVQLCAPNTEGMLLSLIGKQQTQDVGYKEFRKKCKNIFKSHFGCEAHRLKEKRLKEIFSSEKVFKKILPVLHGLFKS